MPYLSFIVVARNDKHGENFLHRLQIFVNVLIELAEKHNLDAELVLVEWNPQKNRSRLKDALNWPKNLKSIIVRIIEVPNEIHRKVPNSDKIPFFQWVAKNVGIQRASSEYVLATNGDILFNEAFIKFLASKPLSKDFFYRIDRYDVNKQIPIDLSVEDQLRFCEEHLYMKYGIYSATLIKTSSIRIFLFRFKSLISFFLSRLFVFIRKFNSFLLNPLALKRVFMRAYKPQKGIFKQITNSSKVFKNKQSSYFKYVINFFLSTLRNYLKTVVFKLLSACGLFIKGDDTFAADLGLHTNAAGEFLIMAKQHWHKLRGYPEIKNQYYIDGYLCFKANALGLQQIILKNPMKIYHQDHDQSEYQKRPRNFQQYIEDSKKMYESKRPIIFNSEDWGLGKEKLVEYRI